jgi:hypothetical protein
VPRFNQQSVSAQACGIGQVSASQFSCLDEDAVVANLMGDTDATDLVEMHTGRRPASWRCCWTWLRTPLAPRGNGCGSFTSSPVAREARRA